jgi:hypothetical protein
MMTAAATPLRATSNIVSGMAGGRHRDNRYIGHLRERRQGLDGRNTLNIYRLDRILSARSLAVIGASPHANSVGRHISANIVAGGFAGQLRVVNPHYLVVSIASGPPKTARHRVIARVILIELGQGGPLFHMRSVLCFDPELACRKSRDDRRAQPAEAGSRR